ncbi:bifunctional methylenetetrahydrofolate dehydrogenase/methenyltetrahydrofolate cyclohydrolase FolD [Azospirillum sp. SYSU D00513]|uniref:bifunctional methylenetetrahydrofolate dehydrogenase/methenyltetrahydrofolate cyclohydrolase FolD n=1 Tax=Azospirillum sp. SYSU D00513 TaxID=2812561 RepID=UPI001A971D7B|nr:bifunctional methylenetetrahydrofolate dehydrogenase/methenyltetrahydrofolate cyclohydrolase FolD [Azospirillum sp. SYSU D00513]
MADATIIDGKAFAAGLRARVAEGVKALKASHGVTPGLAVVLVGEDPASQVYVRSKERALVELGMNSFDHHRDADMTEAELLALIDGLNADPAVHGILVQLPLPRHIDSARVLARIAPEKDADGFHVVNAGLLSTGQPGAILPCTPLGSLLLIRDALGPNLRGKRAVVLGRSNIVGKPMAQLLLQSDCTVTIAHSGTADLPEECRRADILVAAVGRPEMVRGDWIKPGACVIDVGINRVAAAEPGKTRLVGDVAFAEAVKVAGSITPVPGGVGPMTIACLMLNTLTAACRAAGAPVPPEAVLGSGK